MDVDALAQVCERRHWLREFQLHDDHIVALIAAQFIGRKGHRFAFEAMPALCKAHPHFRLVLVSRYADGGIQTMTAEDGLSNNWVSALAEDAKGHMWIGTEGGGVSRYDGEEITVIAASTGAVAPIVRALVVNAKNDLWIGSDSGLSLYSGE